MEVLYEEWFLIVKEGIRIYPYIGTVSGIEDVKSLLDKLKELRPISEDFKDLEENIVWMYNTIWKESIIIEPEDPHYDIIWFPLLAPRRVYKIALEGKAAEEFIKKEYETGRGVVNYFSQKFNIPESIAAFVFVLNDFQRKNFLEGLEKKIEHLYFIEEEMKK